jgi:signal transduction histidine kinase
VRSIGWSLRARLTGLIIAIALLAWGAGSVWVYRSALAEVDALYDAALIETAHAVLAVADREVRRERLERRRGRDDEEHEIELARVAHDHAEFVFYQVRTRNGAIVYRSPGSPSAELAGPGARGFSSATLDGGAAYRVYSLAAGDDGATIHVAQALADRARLARASALRLALPGVALVVALVIAVSVVVRRVTAPVVRFAQAIDARAPGDASVVSGAGLPQELQPVASAVNRLLARVEDALRHERTLTADAAHELRTPLAALRAQSQVALRSRDDEERSSALRALMAGVDRATALVGAVLTLARLDASQLDPAAQPRLDLTTLAKDVIDEFAPIAAGRGVEFTTDFSPAPVRGDADALAILLRNLIDNAIRHARHRVRVQVAVEAGEACLRVQDDGAGLSAAQAQRVFDRFYRGSPGTGDAGSGAGLGLAMVKRIADLHHGSVVVEDPKEGEGATFVVRLPVA